MASTQAVTRSIPTEVSTYVCTAIQKIHQAAYAAAILEYGKAVLDTLRTGAGGLTEVKPPSDERCEYRYLLRQFQSHVFVNTLPVRRVVPSKELAQPHSQIPISQVDGDR